MERVQALSGQRLMTTHSPYFVQHVPLRELRLVRLRGGCTEVASIPHRIISDLPRNDSVDGFIAGPGGRIFFRDAEFNRIGARRWFDAAMSARLIYCYRDDPELPQRTEAVHRLRHACRILPSVEDEEELGFHGRRVRGEIFFARRWILVEGVTEYLLVHARDAPWVGRSIRTGQPSLISNKAIMPEFIRHLPKPLEYRGTW